MPNHNHNSTDDNQKGQGRSADTGRAFDFFEAFNNFVEHWLPHLTSIQKDVYLAYLKHANANGESWPGPRRIADYLQHAKPQHVRAARRDVVELGLMDRIGTGEGGSAKFKIRQKPTPNPGYPERRATPRSGRQYTRAPGYPLTRESGATPTRNSDTEGLIEQPKKQTKRTTQLRVSDSDCESIYRLYPKKKSPEDAFKAIRKAIPIIAKREGITDPIEWLKGRVKAYAEARRRICEADPSQKQFTPYPASWLNARGFDDDQAEWEPAEDAVTVEENGFVPRRPTDEELDELLGKPKQLPPEPANTPPQKPTHTVKIGGKENINVPILK